MEYAYRLWVNTRRQTARASRLSTFSSVVLVIVLVVLRKIFLAHRRRMFKAAAVSLPTTVLGVVSLWVLANVVGFCALLALVINTPCMSVINFFLQRFVWRDRGTRTKRGLKRWAYKEGGFHAASWLYFALMLDIVGLPLMIVNFSKIAGFALPTYVATNKVFKDESEGSAA